MYTDEQIGTLTFTGDPARFVATERVPIAPISMDFEPVQDLHGYEYPWPGGGGKNKFDKATLSLKSNYPLYYNNYYYSDPIILKPNTTYVMTPTSTASLGVTAYYGLFFTASEDDPSDMTTTNDRIRYPVSAGTPRQVVITTGNTGAIRFAVIGDTSGVNETYLNAFMSINYQLEEGSTATAWTPYSNICPITGRDSVNVYVSPEPTITDGTEVHTIEFPVQGFNQWDEEWRNGYYDTTGVFVPSGSYIASKNKIPLLPSTSYTIHCTKKYIGRLCFYDANEDFVSTIMGISSTTDYTFTTPSNAYYMNFDMTSAYGAVYTHDISINYPATETSYYPYKGRTVYGGTITINEDGSGQIIITMGSINLGELDWRLHGIENPPIYPYGYWGANCPNKANGEVNIISSHYKTISPSFSAEDTVIFGSNGSEIIYLVSSELNHYTKEQFTELVKDVQIVYELAKPVTINLSVEQIKTLIGLNYVWTNEHILITITFPYRKEIQPMAMNYDFCWTYPKAYIDKLEARIAALETAAAAAEATAETAVAPADTREAVTEENVTEGITITEEPETEPVTKKGGK